jgi:hypothetical protein
MAMWLFVLLASMSARAHHSFSAVFDGKKPITLTGPVTKIEWANPHIHVHIDVKDETGQVINWAIEMGSPNFLIRLGWDTRCHEGWRRGHNRTDSRNSTPTLARPLSASVVDENLPHQPGRNGEKVCAVVERQFVQVDEPQIHFMHECRSL